MRYCYQSQSGAKLCLFYQLISVPHPPSIIQLILATTKFLKSLAVKTTDEFSQSSSIWGVTASTPVESMIASITKTGEQSLSCSKSVLELLSGLEVSRFISNIREESASFLQGRLSKSLNHIIAVLCELLLDVNIEGLPELTSFCVKGNSLLDCATTTRLATQELQQWESKLRNMEFRLFTIHTARENVVKDKRVCGSHIQ